MKLFEGKSTTERNKIIAAIVLGVLCLFVFYFAFGRSLFSSSATVSVKVSPTPKPTTTTSSKADPDKFRLPSEDEQNLIETSTPISYNQASFYAPDPGRNIFAFYEPPAPTPYSPTPIPITPIPTPPIPPPTPEPKMLIAFVTPQSVYAGSKGFRLEINGDRFIPDARIYFSQNEVPTTFISGQKLVADIPESFIAGEGPQQIIVQTPDGKIYSNQVMLEIQAAPKPQFQYIGMIARKRSNNDTAYFLETGKPTPMSARLNDIVTGRFRLVSISAAETILEDVNLGFRYKLPLFQPPPGTAVSSPPPVRGGFQSGDNYIPFNPTIQNGNMNTQRIPGIPDNIPRYVPPTNKARQPSDKKDVDEDDDDDGDN